jgi:outer membrane protein assembly factor BamD (BamD/ComL family)
VDDNDKLAATAAKNCKSIADELLHDYPKSDYASRAASIAFRVAQGIPITGSDRD